MNQVAAVLAPPAQTTPASPWPLTVATYNIHSAIGTDGRFDPERIARVLLDIGADVIALQEVPLGGSESADVLKVLQEATGFHAVEGPTEDTPQRRYGNAVLSRYPVQATRAIDLSFGSREARGALDADLACHGQPLRVVATHLGLRPAERRDQIKRLLQAFDTDRMPVILMGDVNEWLAAVFARPHLDQSAPPLAESAGARQPVGACRVRPFTAGGAYRCLAVRPSLKLKEVCHGTA